MRYFNHVNTSAMSFRYQKRINLGKGAGLNVSKSGVSGSVRSRRGSIGTRGFSIRTGIPGLTFRTSWGKSKNGLIVLVIVGVIAFAGLVLYNLVKLFAFLATRSHVAIKSSIGKKRP